MVKLTEKQREIKFRIWDNKEKTMYFQETEEKSDGEIETQFREEGTIGIWLIANSIFNHPKSFIVQQFTGLKDCKGKDIFEGDIVKEKNKKYIITFVIGKYGFSPINFPADFLNCDLYEKEVEVIGNKFENPELLKEKK